eukprot:6172497-Pleurochrysis_carterae.AAC.2
MSIRSYATASTSATIFDVAHQISRQTYKLLERRSSIYESKLPTSWRNTMLVTRRKHCDFVPKPDDAAAAALLAAAKKRETDAAADAEKAWVRCNLLMPSWSI